MAMYDLNSSLALTLWFVAFFSGMKAFEGLKKYLRNLLETGRISGLIDQLRKGARQLEYIKELLQSGSAPSEEDWLSLSKIAQPWGRVSYQSLQELRSHGAPCVPTLKRLKMAMEDQVETLLEAQSKSASAWGQVWIGLILVPSVALSMYYLLPGPAQHLEAFLIAVGFSLFLILISMFWLIYMIESSQFGGIEESKKKWFPTILVFFERLSALISVGTPPDIAWKKVLEEIAQSTPDLAQVWGFSIWGSAEVDRNTSGPELELFLKSTGTETRRMIQAALSDGRPVLERLHDQQKAFLVEYRLKMSRELSQLPQRCLKPLFLCLAPAVLIIFGVSIFLTVQTMGMQ